MFSRLTGLGKLGFTVLALSGLGVVGGLWGNAQAQGSSVQGSSAQGEVQGTPVRIGLGYVPNVQFTPFYVAEKLGYFKAEGLSANFQHGYVSELMPLLLQGKLDFVVGDPEDVVFARSQGAPVRYTLAMYQHVPVTVFSLKNKNIRVPSDLKGKTVGIPGPFGSSYLALQALLGSAGLAESDIKLASIGFTQQQAVRAGQVDAAVGYLNNDVVALKSAGLSLNTLDVSKAYPMVGVGLITTDKVLSGAVGRKVARAVQRGMQFTLQDPARAYKLAQPTFGQGGGSLDVLKASLPLMRSALTSQQGLGYNDPAAWARSVAFLQRLGKAQAGLKPTDFYSNALLSKTLR